MMATQITTSKTMIIMITMQMISRIMAIIMMTKIRITSTMKINSSKTTMIKTKIIIRLLLKINYNNEIIIF